MGRGLARLAKHIPTVFGVAFIILGLAGADELKQVVLQKLTLPEAWQSFITNLTLLLDNGLSRFLLVIFGLFLLHRSALAIVEADDERMEKLERAAKERSESQLALLENFQDETSATLSRSIQAMEKVLREVGVLPRLEASWRRISDEVAVLEQFAAATLILGHRYAAEIKQCSVPTGDRAPEVRRKLRVLMDEVLIIRDRFGPRTNEGFSQWQVALHDPGEPKVTIEYGPGDMVKSKAFNADANSDFLDLHKENAKLVLEFGERLQQAADKRRTEADEAKQKFDHELRRLTSDIPSP